MTEAGPRSLYMYTSRGYYTVKKPIAHVHILSSLEIADL